MGLGEIGGMEPGIRGGGGGGGGAYDAIQQGLLTGEKGGMDRRSFWHFPSLNSPTLSL
ncbi:hypothetical protein K6U57_23855 [Vibrio alginolyticus]|uniref:hypothetical protein n=1 Tax=Vibrio alginolyticus TaxID=663 RepID=UPI001EEA7F47|nr:hypothetical protein [Vibrio alginolyticus]MCG6339488.1 hypothetical protein [Vibrio alginolyticus]